MSLSEFHTPGVLRVLVPFFIIITFVAGRIKACDTENFLGLNRDVGELLTIVTIVGHLMRHDQFMLGIRGDLQNRFLRLAADFANYKRRNEAERAEIADWARRDFTLALLPILDDFGLMVEYETQHPERLAEGAKLIRQKMTEFLAK